MPCTSLHILLHGAPAGWVVLGMQHPQQAYPHPVASATTVGMGGTAAWWWPPGVAAGQYHHTAPYASASPTAVVVGPSPSPPAVAVPVCHPYHTTPMHSPQPLPPAAVPYATHASPVLFPTTSVPAAAGGSGSGGAGAWHSGSGWIQAALAPAASSPLLAWLPTMGGSGGGTVAAVSTMRVPVQTQTPQLQPLDLSSVVGSTNSMSLSAATATLPMFDGGDGGTMVLLRSSAPAAMGHTGHPFSVAPSATTPTPPCRDAHLCSAPAASTAPTVYDARCTKHRSTAASRAGGTAKSSRTHAAAAATSSRRPSVERSTPKLSMDNHPSLLLNVFYFWMLSLCRHGSTLHNGIVLRHLLRVRSVFVEQSRNASAAAAAPPSASNATPQRVRDYESHVVKPLKACLHVHNTDTSIYVVKAFNILGGAPFAAYLRIHGVIADDTDDSDHPDLATVWAYVIARADPSFVWPPRLRTTDGAPAARWLAPFTDPAEMLEAMTWAQRVSIPCVDDEDAAALGTATISQSGGGGSTPPNVSVRAWA